MVNDMGLSIFSYQFMQNAIIASLMVSLICGVMGVMIVEKKLTMMTGGIAHTSYGGVGLGYLLGFEPLIGAFGISILAAIAIAFIKRRGKTRIDVATGLFWSFGMALGVLFISLMPGYPPDLGSYLFGNMLSITRSDLMLMASMTFLVSLSVAGLYNYWKAYMFDEEFLAVIGVKTAIFDYLFMVLVAVSTVVLIRVTGIVLVLALITAPVASAELFTRSLKTRIAFSIISSAAFCLTGLLISVWLDISAGSSIVVVAVLSYVIMYVIAASALKRNGN
jgi:zinc transport system permease protein